MSEIVRCFLIVYELAFSNNLKARRGILVKKNMTSNIFPTVWREEGDSRSFQ